MKVNRRVRERMPEWMRKFADVCTAGHLYLLACRSTR